MSITTPGGLHVRRIQSKAGFATSIHISVPGTTDGILFDCGSVDQIDVNVKFVFVSHGHVDHIGACVTHARSRALSLSPAIYYVPENCVSSLTKAKEAFEELDEHEIRMDIRPLLPGCSVSISKNHKVFAFPTRHRVNSQGYGVTHTAHSIMSEYSHLSPSEIGKLKKQKIEVTQKTENIELVYTGDTVFSGLLEAGLEFVFTCNILIIELTFLDGDLARAHKWGHIHIDEIIHNIHRFQNEQVIFMHLSPRYSPPSRAITLLCQKIPVIFHSRFAVGLLSLGADEHITKLDKSWESRNSSEELGWGWAKRTFPRKLHKQQHQTSDSGRKQEATRTVRVSVDDSAISCSSAYLNKSASTSIGPVMKRGTEGKNRFR